MAEGEPLPLLLRRLRARFSALRGASDGLLLPPPEARVRVQTETGNMILPPSKTSGARFMMADHGGDSVKGGGHPADETVSADEEIRDAMGEMTPQRRGTPGTNDPGVPGSRTETGRGKPERDESARAHPHPGPQTGEGGSG